jgi:hypothetical protein
VKIGYSYWGFLGDHKEDGKGNVLSTPDGNAAYGGYLVNAMQEAGHKVYMLQEDRDWDTFKRRGKYDFQAFSQDIRCNAYLKMYRSGWKVLGIPDDLDVAVMEWRFPVPGRNTPEMKGKPGYQPDLERQQELVEFYQRLGIPIIIWDLDYKFTPDDERLVKPVAVLETAVNPRSSGFTVPHLRVEPPVRVADLLQLTPKPLNPNRKLVYVGSRYERDDIIEEWIKPVSDRFPQQVEFFGNWTAEYNFAEVQAKWPNVKYQGRISMKDFAIAYGDAVACPLLAKKEYLERGFITPRIWEALIFGTIPVGLSSHTAIGEYLPDYLIAENAHHLGDIVEILSRKSPEERQQIRQDVASRIKFMDAGNFVRVIEGAING